MYRSFRRAATALLFTLCLCGTGHYGSAQTNTEELRKRVENSRRQLDSLSKSIEASIQRRTDSLTKSMTTRSIQNTMDWVNRYQQQKKREQRRKAFLYIGFGAAMLGVLVYGLSRRRKRVV